MAFASAFRRSPTAMTTAACHSRSSFSAANGISAGRSFSSASNQGKASPKSATWFSSLTRYIPTTASGAINGGGSKLRNLGKTTVAVLSAGFLVWGYQAIKPPPPKICGSPDGPAVTAPRIKLRDGRHLAYQEHGVPKQNAKHKIVFVHGFGSCRQDGAATVEYSPEIVKELGIYVVSFDRPGYGESDPDPKRTAKSLALDIEELADGLGLGSKFYVMGFSMGGQAVWGCLKYISHRLSGAALLAPVANYWWSGIPKNLSKEAYDQQLKQDQWAVRVAHYTPWLTYFWNTQKWFPGSSVVARSLDVLSPADIALLPKLDVEIPYMHQITQQGVLESLFRDMNVGFGTWEFSPLDLENPFPNNEASVHIWHGDEDKMVPVTLNRYIAQQLPWIQYHEVPGAGHLFPYADGMSDSIFKALLTDDGKKPSST